MAVSESSRNALLPSFLYAVPVAAGSTTTTSSPFSAAAGLGGRGIVAPSAGASTRPAVWAQSPSEPARKIEMYSPAFYAACTAGGIASCGLTHMTVTPLDLVKCNMQINPAKYKSISSGFGVLLKEQGARGFFRGWVPTLIGYSGQGACKFGFYEFFKKYYSDIAGPENAAKYKTLIYLAGSASAEVIADVALWKPSRLYKGIVPLWGRQIPSTMMKFASFETIVEMIYKYAIPAPKSECSKPLQLGVSFAGGYVAGVFCAIVSHPADNLVSFPNNAQGATVGDAVKKLDQWGLFTRGLPLRIVMIVQGDLIKDHCLVQANYWWSCSNTCSCWRAAEGLRLDSIPDF
ncbi:hypothetical protein ACQ4PT_023647 [Festuca glaucescens]